MLCQTIDKDSMSEKYQFSMTYFKEGLKINAFGNLGIMKNDSICMYFTGLYIKTAGWL